MRQSAQVLGSARP